MAAPLSLSGCGLSLGASSVPKWARFCSQESTCGKAGVIEQHILLAATPRRSGLTDSPIYVTRQRTPRHSLKILGSATDKKNKIAKLYVTQQKSVPLPCFCDSQGDPQHLRVFLSQPEGRQSMLNTKALDKYEDLGDNKFRCYLPKIDFLSFEVAPVIDLLVAANEDNCQVELLSCKFEGSDIVRSQNERFSASLKNHLVWSTKQNQEVLDVKLELNVFLEVYTLPFTLLPVSAVESPGTLIMQSLVDRLLPLFVDNMFKDYQTWAQTHPKDRSLEENASKT
ncbi:hypothetical protein MPTK1_4g02240 [Marchantia polymorpha subsp. ruderalis]|uniref:Uncharacterized protein n=2 Tax=Marchantia polymorpha TaxID=3197 RepID=A0A176W2F2_MARPO|nr:hypothetical protein AXG93_473s1090 [Marchantia polymorpha subsp. ruderalis]PTQ34460.1 hypothetical protein MARPO_0080s0075 [Marchantia polymorpha]BBN07246.1 hypothetical protein Mp_4g02240 [Marchantia polymorpha subsp. ruderalis]|eukprot:PTQ34460.1 hypothetical protein MARPO_0080s0075 [Marchantia polymorpha]